MSKSEMEMFVASIGEMLREYTSSLSEDEPEWREGYTTTKADAEKVFRGLLTWLRTEGADA
jgi:hypothetical protein